MATVNLGSIKFKWKGTYSGATAYTIDDVVEYNGSSYICILASTGNLPTNATYFEQMSSAGTNGTNGTDLTSTLTTQGDILYRDGSGLVRLGAGTAGQVLQTGGAGANPSWQTSSGGVLQMVHTEISTYPSRSDGTTYADIAGLNLTITPSSASSKILIVFNAGIVSNDSRTTAFVLERDISGSTTLLGGHTDGSRKNAWVRHASGDDGNHDYGVHASYYDSPNTTSAITYTVQWISQGTAWLNRSENYVDGGETYQSVTNSRVYAMEIGV
jgi:hypothetical protein